MSNLNVLFISDFFVNQIAGGAEIYDDILIKELLNIGHKVVPFNSNLITKKYLEFYLKWDFHIIVSNFSNLSKEAVDYLQIFKNRYSILEHDHKYDKNRNPAVYGKPYYVPQENIVNKYFYQNAKYIFCQSIKHEEIIKNSLKLNNTINLGCSLWDTVSLNKIRNKLDQEKTIEHLFIKETNPIKGSKEAEKYCKDNSLNCVALDKTNFDNYLENLSKSKKFIFFPKAAESFSRVILEARMLNCSLITNDLNGCTYESWFKQYKGRELIDFVDSQRKIIVDKICSLINSKETSESKEKDITVILNCYRRPYNLKMQIESIKNQSIKPKEIWLWVNHHEDNKDFDFNEIKVDKIFKNDYNWKFYGRFAAALLADTEYIAVYDDDTIPGSNWHKNCLETMETSPGILGSAGIILKDKRYINHDRCGWPTQNLETTQVDLVGHSWFFKRDWLQYLWKEKPYTWDNGEDIQFSYMAQVYGGINTYCPPHPKEDRSLHGSILGNELGIDNKATSTNSSVSHEQFFTERDLCVQNGIANGWKTVRDVKL